MSKTPAVQERHDLPADRWANGQAAPAGRHPLPASPLVGREEELACLLHFLDGAGRGVGHVVLLRGELEFARLVAEGLTTAQVAKRLIISPHTADAHLRRLYERLNIHSRAALARYLTESGLL